MQMRMRIIPIMMEATLLKRMQSMKILLIILVMSLTLPACSKLNDNTDSADSDETLIVTSFYPIYVFTSNIAKDVPGVRVVNMTEPQTGCLHDYQLVPANLKTLEKAEIFVINGAGIESFLDKVISQLPKLTLVEGVKDIPLLKDGNGEENPHVWVSVSGAILEVQNITDGLVQADPANEAAYRKNSQAYIQRLEDLKTRMKVALQNVKTRDIVTFHEAFPYFAQEFDLSIVSVVEREPGSEPSAGELANTIEIIKQAGVKVLFAEPQYSQKVAESIASQTGAKVYTLDPVVTGPKDAPLDSYEKTMEENLKVLIEALK